MPSGSATQTKLQFINKDSRPSDTPKNTNGGEQHGDIDRQQQQIDIAQREKRQRDELEENTDDEVNLLWKRRRKKSSCYPNKTDNLEKQ